MAWVVSVEAGQGDGKMQPTSVVARCKIFELPDGTRVLQIDTHGSSDRVTPGKQSQTLQFGVEAATVLHALLSKTFDLR